MPLTASYNAQDSPTTNNYRAQNISYAEDEKQETKVVLKVDRDLQWFVRFSELGALLQFVFISRFLKEHICDGNCMI